MSRWLFNSILFLTGAASLTAGVKETVAKTPLHFEPNRGQVAGQTEWITQAPGANVYITGSEVVFALLPKMPREPPSKPLFTHNVHMRLVGASRDAKAEPLEPLGSYSSYFAGKTEKDWFTGIPHYGRVRYRNVYPGIDLVYYRNQQNVEYDFIVAAGADPSRIELAFSNVDSLRVERGDLVINAAGRDMKQRKPRVFQAGRELECSYRIVNGKRATLALGGFDAGQPLTIDPVLEFSTYIGGPGDDYGRGVSLDSSGFIYYAGATQSPVSPALNPFQQSNIVSEAPFVLKFTPTADKIVYFAEIGSGSNDDSQSIAVDASGSAIVFGRTENPNFPLKNPIQSTYTSSVYSTYVAKLAPDGKSLVFATYFGGSYVEFAESVALDAQGNAFITGFTLSNDIPIRSAFQPTSQGGDECFLAKISPAGSLVFSTYLGGTGTDHCYGLAIGPDGGPYVSGGSSSHDFPLKNAMQTEITARDTYPTPFVAKFRPDGSSVVFSTFAGGKVSGDAYGIALDAASNIYIAGGLYDNNLATKNALQSTAGSPQNGFLIKLDSQAHNIVFSTYLGGTGSASINTIAVDRNGGVYAVGRAGSADFPARDSLFPFRGGGIYQIDTFAAKFTPDGSALIYSTFLGGSHGDTPGQITLDSSGSLLIAGTSASTDYPVKNAFQPASGGGIDCFLAKLSDNTIAVAPPLSASPARLSFVYVQGASVPVAQTVFVSGSSVGFSATSSATWLSASPSSASAPASLSVSVNPSGLPPGAYSATINVAPPGAMATSIDVGFTVSAAPPVLRSITPAVVAPGSNDTTVVLEGSGFAQNSSVLLFGAPWKDTPVTFVDGGTLRIVVPSRYFSMITTYQFTVQNPQSAVSNTVVLSVGIPAPYISTGGVVNAASYVGNSVSPGEIVAIFGSNFGTQANTQVLIDGIAAKVIYVTPTQLSATVPYGISNASTSLVIQSRGQSSAPVTIPVVPATPAIFTADATGKGQGAILNQDSSVNSATNPAATGSVVVLYGTGGGGLTNDSPARLSLPVSATIGGIDAPVLYAGVAPGLVSGAIQVNVQVPNSVPSGAVPVVLQVGDARSRSDVTLAVQ